MRIAMGPVSMFDRFKPDDMSARVKPAWSWARPEGAQIVDMSDTTISLRTRHPLQRGRKIRVELVNGVPGHLLRVTGVVRFVCPEGGGCHRIEVSLPDLTPAVRSRLRRLRPD